MQGVSMTANLFVVIVMLRISAVTSSGCDDGACVPQTVQIYQIPKSSIVVSPPDVTCNNTICKIDITDITPELMIDSELKKNITTWSTKIWNSTSSILQVNITIDLGKDHSLEDDLIVTFRSKLPNAMILEKSNDYGDNWDVLQYYSSNCLKDFTMNQTLHSSDVQSTTDILCVNPTNEQTGNVYFLVKPRFELLSPGLTNPVELHTGLENDTALQDLLSLTNLRIRLLRPGNETIYDPENSSLMLHTAQYAISNIQTSLSCNCNLHGNHCYLKDGVLSCDCHHNTEGRSCERCRRMYDLLPWQRASLLPVTKGTANSCQLNITTINTTTVGEPTTVTPIKTTDVGEPRATTTSICATNPCKNQGTCVKTNTEFTCQCTGGYTGSTCELVVDPCESNPCTSPNLCKTENNGYTCTDNDSGLSTNTIIIISAVSGGIVLFIGWVCFILYCATYKQKTEKMNRKSQKYNVQTAKVNGQSMSGHYTKNTDLLVPDGLSSARVHELQEKWNIKEPNLMLGKLLSSGKFSYVCEGSLKEDDTVVETKVAIKLLKDESDEASKNEMLNEFSILSTIGTHNNTVHLLGMCTRTLEQSTQLCLVMEFIARGNMQRILRRCRSRRRDQPPIDPLPEDELLGYAYDVIMGLKHLDSLGILHMNICAKNVLITFNNKAKICDFGRAVEIQEPEQYTRYKPHPDEQKKRWMACETLDGLYNTKSEVWSYGMLLYEIVTLGGIPYADIKLRNLKEKLKEHHRMEWPRHCSQDLYNLMLSCWHRRPDSRPSINLLAKEIKLFKSSSKKNLCLKDYPFQTYIAIRYPEEFDDPMAINDSFV